MKKIVIMVSQKNVNTIEVIQWTVKNMLVTFSTIKKITNICYVLFNDNSRVFTKRKLKSRIQRLNKNKKYRPLTKISKPFNRKTH